MFSSSKKRKPQAEGEVDQLKSCHQCQGNDNGGFVECNKCKSNIYCVPCITKWYPDIPKEDLVEACPVCRDNCNCKKCLNGFSPNSKGNGTKDWQSDSDVNQVPIALRDSEKKKPQEANGLWRGFNVGVGEKELLDSIELHHPTTFQEVKFRSEQIWLPILKHFYKKIKDFLETTVNSVTEGELTTHKENFEELERIGFNISWASERLDMVKKLKFGNEPLISELTELEESLQAAKEHVAEQQKAYLEAHEKLKEVQFEYNGISQAMEDKMQEMAGLYGDDYDRVLKSHLGLGMLPEY
uniref:uncharacterized protein LOC122583902 n=1 Tax=Erigeron canadensis TaxID=72917 RepID=UPI001CB903D1|nr:uncharacterized protein LOC122583902 [Erigeron canadensis]